jgi:hypothetical protein
MSALGNEFDLVLTAVNPTVASMALELLWQAGIPSMLGSREALAGDFGMLTPNPFTSPDLFVPRGQRGRAQKLLKDAWDVDAEFPTVELP